jgi:hypothetical protein
MGATSLDTAAVAQFNAAMDVAEQQKVTRLSPLTEVVSIQGEKWYYDDLGIIESQRANNPNTELSFSEIAIGRRKMTKERIYTALLVDELEVNNMLTDPMGKLAMGCVFGHERERDRVVYSKMFSTVYLGKDGDTSTSFATDGGLTIDATAGYTYDTLLEINANLIDYEVEAGQVYSGLTADEHSNLLGEIEVTSGDYTRQYNIEKGSVQQASGVQFIKFGAAVNNPILQVVGGERISFAGVAGCMVFGIGQQRKISSYDHPLMVDSTILKVVETVGAVRKKPNGARLQKIRLTP